MDFDFKKLIKFVKDRPGHDFRYSVDISKMKRNLKWEPKRIFEENLKITNAWYLNNLTWCKKILEKSNFKDERLEII